MKNDLTFEEIDEVESGRIGTLIELVWIFDDLYQAGKLPVVKENFNSPEIKKELYKMSMSFPTHEEVMSNLGIGLHFEKWLESLTVYAEPRMIELWGNEKIERR